jgi:hypothetical protein
MILQAALQSVRAAARAAADNFFEFKVTRANGLCYTVKAENVKQAWKICEDAWFIVPVKKA